MSKHNYNPVDNTQACPECKGTGRIKHACKDNEWGIVEGHPLNCTDRDDGALGRQGYVVQQCRVCKMVRGMRYQWDPGSGSDHHIQNFGRGDPLRVATERHY